MSRSGELEKPRRDPASQEMGDRTVEVIVEVLII